MKSILSINTQETRPSFPRRAFSLLEALLALTIFSIAVVGITEGITAQIRAERYAEDVTRATMLAQNALEEIRLKDTLEEERQTGQFEDDNAEFEWEYAIASTEKTGLYRVTVTVSWSDGLARKDYALETLLADRGSAEQQSPEGNPTPGESRMRN